MTPDVFNKGMRELFAAHQRKEDSDTMDSYWKSLLRLSDAQFSHAVNRSRDNDEQFPKIPKLRAYANEVKSEGRSAAQRFSFLCTNCNMFFSVPIDMLEGESRFKCDYCDHYHGETITFESSYLLRKMEEAKAEGRNVAEI